METPKNIKGEREILRMQMALLAEDSKKLSGKELAKASDAMIGIARMLTAFWDGSTESIMLKYRQACLEQSGTDQGTNYSGLED